MLNNTGQMMQGLEEVTQLQQKAFEIKQWLVNHHTADSLAIREQRKRLQETLLLITKTVKNENSNMYFNDCSYGNIKPNANS
jgi:hypothetical protein